MAKKITKELQEIYPGVPVLDAPKKEALKAIFEQACGQARDGELPQSRWEAYQEKRAEQTKGKKEKPRDKRMRPESTLINHNWFEKHGDPAVQNLTTAEFTRAHEAVRNHPDLAKILYDDDSHKIYDSDLNFALKQIYAKPQHFLPYPA